MRSSGLPAIHRTGRAAAVMTPFLMARLTEKFSPMRRTGSGIPWLTGEQAQRLRQVAERTGHAVVGLEHPVVDAVLEPDASADVLAGTRGRAVGFEHGVDLGAEVTRLARGDDRSPKLGLGGGQVRGCGGSLRKGDDGRIHGRSPSNQATACALM